MYQDKILRFIGAAKEWEEQTLFEVPRDLTLNNYLGKVTDCILFSRACDIDEMENEDDEAYILTTPDRSVSCKFNRFEIRKIFRQMNEKFDRERIDLMLKMAWNYSRIVINKVTTEYCPFNDSTIDKLPPMPASGGPPRRTIFID